MIQPGVVEEIEDHLVCQDDVVPGGYFGCGNVVGDHKGVLV